LLSGEAWLAKSEHVHAGGHRLSCC
jgi:hypothetical protein